jgi:hypothetical protein
VIFRAADTGPVVDDVVVVEDIVRVSRGSCLGTVVRRELKIASVTARIAISAVRLLNEKLEGVESDEA